MKRTLLVFTMLLTLFCLFGCKAEIKPKPELVLADTKPTIPANGIPGSGGTYKVTVNSNSEWTASSDSEWISMTIDEHSATIIVAENISLDSRPIVVSFSIYGHSEIIKWEQIQLGGIIQIKTNKDLVNLASNVNNGDEQEGKYYQLMNDIDLKGDSYNNWIPIGKSDPDQNFSYSFKGNFNGGGFVISGIYIDSEDSHQGLFHSSSGVIENLGVKGTVSGSGYVGGIVGSNSGIIRNCNSECIVEAKSNYVGGIAGYNKETIENCFNKGSVSGKRGYVGGITGYSSRAINGCSNTRSVNGSGWYVGGVIGSLNSSGVVSNCYNAGFVSGEMQVGGVIGHSLALSTISNCYNIGGVNGEEYIGGVVGNAGGDVTGCYNEGKVDGLDSYVGGVVGSGRFISDCYNTGDVTGSYDVGGVVGSGSFISDCYNTGKIRGNELSDYVSDIGGIIGEVSYGKVDNCYNIGNVYLSQNSSSVGGIVGDNYDGNITNCYNSGAISGRVGIGGVAGDNNKGSITQSYNTGEISGYSASGGITGSNITRASIMHCYNTGVIASTHAAGGIAGTNDKQSNIAHCYNTGNISAINSVGGIAGDDSGTVEVSFAISECVINGAGGNNGVIVSEEDMKTDIFIGKLNESQDTEVWSLDVNPSINNSFPILIWQIQN